MMRKRPLLAPQPNTRQFHKNKYYAIQKCLLLIIVVENVVNENEVHQIEARL